MLIIYWNYHQLLCIKSKLTTFINRTHRITCSYTTSVTGWTTKRVCIFGCICVYWNDFKETDRETVTKPLPQRLVTYQEKSTNYAQILASISETEKQSLNVSLQCYDTVSLVMVGRISCTGNSKRFFIWRQNRPVNRQLHHYSLYKSKT